MTVDGRVHRRSDRARRGAVPAHRQREGGTARGEVGGAQVIDGNRMSARGQTRGREAGRASAQGRRADRDAAVQEGNRTGRRPFTRRDRDHGDREGRRLAKDSRARRRAGRGAGAGLANRLNQGGRGTTDEEVTIPAVGGQNIVAAGGQAGSAQRGRTVTESARAERHRPIQEGDHSGGRSRSRRHGGDGRGEGHRLAEDRRGIRRGNVRSSRLGLVDLLSEGGHRATAGEAGVAVVAGQNGMAPGNQGTGRKRGGEAAQRHRSQRSRAVEEGHGAGRRARSGGHDRHRCREGHRLTEDRRRVR